MGTVPGKGQRLWNDLPGRYAEASMYGPFYFVPNPNLP